MDFKVLYHSSIVLDNRIYIDPFGIKTNNPKADYIFITHIHDDHFSIHDIEKIIKENTVFIATADVAEKIKLQFENEVYIVQPDKTYNIRGLKFKSFKSYNTDKLFHTEDKNWIGYIIYLFDKSYAILGDTDINEDVKKIRCDILFIPIGGKYTMNAKEAAELTNIIKPSVVIPTHYNTSYKGNTIGTKDSEQEFIKNVKNSINILTFL